MKIVQVLNKYLSATFPEVKTDPDLDNRKGFLKVAFIALIEFLLLMTFFPLTYETNDNFWMNAIASGAHTGTPSEFLVFISVIIGKILKFLYTFIPSVNWFTVFLLSSLFMGYVAIQFSFYKLKTNYAIRIVRHLLVLALMFYTLTQSGFTRIAGVVAAGGFMLLFINRDENRKQLLLGVFLLILASMIRIAVFYMYLALSLPFLFVFLFKRKYIRLLYVASAFVLALFIFKMNQRISFQSPEFSEFRQFNSVRGKLMGSHNPFLDYSIIEENVKDAGFSYSDYRLVVRSAYDITHEKFNPEKLETLIVDKQSFIEKTFDKQFISVFKDTVRQVWKYIDIYYYYYIGIFISMFFLVGKRPRELGAIVVYSLYVLLLAFFLYYYREGMLKSRVLFGMLLPVALFIIYYFDENGNIPKKIPFMSIPKSNNVGLLLINIALITLFFTVYINKEKASAIYNARDKTHKYFEYIEKQDHDFYVSRIRGAPYYIYKNPPDHSNAYVLGWFIGSPSNAKKVEKYTGKKNAGIFTIFNKDIVMYFDLLHYRAQASLLVKFYRNNYDNCRIESNVIKLSRGTKLYKYTFHIPKLDISPMSTLGVQMRFGEQDRISKFAAKGLSLRLLSGGPGETELPKDMEAFEDLEIPEEIEEYDEE